MVLKDKVVMSYKYKVGEKIRLFKKLDILFQVSKPINVTNFELVESEIIAIEDTNSRIAYIVLMPEGINGFRNYNFREIKNNSELKEQYRIVYEAAILPYKKLKCMDCK